MSTHQGRDRARPSTSTRAKEHTPQRGPNSTEVLQRLKSDPGGIRPTDVLALQRTIGNRATGRLLQAKLQLGPAGDQYEQEADKVAQQVVRASRQPNVQRDKEDDGTIQTNRFANSMVDYQQSTMPVAAGISRVQRGFVAQLQTSELQREEMHDEEMQDEEIQASPNHGLAGGDVAADVARSIQRAKGGGKPLHEGVRTSMEQGFGADFSSVRVHTGKQADALNRSLNAKAFTTGKDIFFGKGQYNPGSSGGQELIAHELTHTVQQGAARVQRQTAVTTNPTRTFRRAPDQALIQRSEADAVSLANQLDPGPNPQATKYKTWSDLTTARANNVAVIVTNWSRIADAYIKKSTVVFASYDALVAEADRMLLDTRSWTDPQARREASHVLQQMVPKLASFETQIKSPAISGQPQTFQDIATRISTLSSKIQQIQDKFLMSYRGEGQGSKKSKNIFSKKKRTVLSLPQKAGPNKGKLELFNKINPTTNRKVALGKGGMGYGRFGKLDGSEKFVKKQKLKKNEASIQAGAHKQVYALDQDSQNMYLSWIEQEMTKFRNELNYTTNILDHENVIKTHGGSVGLGSDNMPTAYMVMDMMQSDLKKMIEKDEWNEQTKIEIMKGVLAGLAHVHGKGLLHRDIKPENIMLDKNGVPKLIDFGEAVQMDHEHKFLSDDRAGTAGYQHPEKIKMKPILFDRNTDLYALQKTFEEMKPSTGAVQGWLTTFDDSHDAAGLLNALKDIDIDE